MLLRAINVKITRYRNSALFFFHGTNTSKYARKTSEHVNYPIDIANYRKWRNVNKTSPDQLMADT